MNKFIVFVTVFFTGLLSAQITESREIADFSKLKVSQSIEVLYTVSNTRSLKIETDLKENLPFIKTEVENGTLKVFIDNSGNLGEKKSKKRRWNNNISYKYVKVTVSGPNLSEIKASSSGVVKILNLNKSEYLNITVSSSGSVKGNFECENASIAASSSGTFSAELVAKNTSMEASSSGTIALKGRATHLDCKASSSGDCNLKDFKVENAMVSGSSSAMIAVQVSKALNAKASSSADIIYYGNPANVTKDVSSSGSVSKK